MLILTQTLEGGILQYGISDYSPLALVTPTLFLICGLPGSGKTTLARLLERDSPALRLCPDEWMKTLYGPDPTRYGPFRSPVEAVQWTIAQRVLRLGANVILEYGFWSKDERLAYRRRGEQEGAAVKLIFLDLPLEELWTRLSLRNASLEPGTLPVSRTELETWWSWFERPTADEFTTFAQG